MAIFTLGALGLAAAKGAAAGGGASGIAAGTSAGVGAGVGATSAGVGAGVGGAGFGGAATGGGLGTLGTAAVQGAVGSAIGGGAKAIDNTRPVTITKKNVRKDRGFYGHYDPTKVAKVNVSGGSKPISKMKLDGTAWGKCALKQVIKRSK